MTKKTPKDRAFENLADSVLHTKMLLEAPHDPMDWDEKEKIATRLCLTVRTSGDELLAWVIHEASSFFSLEETKKYVIERLEREFAHRMENVSKYLVLL